MGDKHLHLRAIEEIEGEDLSPDLLLSRALSLLGDLLNLLLRLLSFLLSDHLTRASKPPPDRARASLRGPLPDSRPVGVRARASEEPVEVAVGDPGAHRAAEDAEKDVEERVRQSVVYMEAH
jgi:hypothetical protein